MSATRDEERELEEALALARRLQEEIDGLRLEIAGMNDGYTPMSLEERERLDDLLDEKTDGELVWTMICMQKLIQERTVGQLRNVVERQTAVVVAVLDRFAPAALADGLAIYTEFDGGEEEESAARA
jgi:hypothetical protein